MTYPISAQDSMSLYLLCVLQLLTKSQLHCLVRFSSMARERQWSV